VARTVMIISAYTGAAIGVLIAQAVAGERGMAVGGIAGFCVGSCLAGLVYVWRGRKG